jgi:ankyrin repeat protein
MDILESAQIGDLKAVDRLLQGLDPNSPDIRGRTLSIAARNGHEEVVKLLLDKDDRASSTFQSYGAEIYGRWHFEFAILNAFALTIHKCRPLPLLRIRRNFFSDGQGLRNWISMRSNRTLRLHNYC